MVCKWSTNYIYRKILSILYVIQCRVDRWVRLLQGRWYVRLCWRCCRRVVVVVVIDQPRLVRRRRDEAEARRCVVQESWEQLEAYLTLVESRVKDARMAFTRISERSMASLFLLPAPISGSLSLHSSSTHGSSQHSYLTSVKEPTSFPCLTSPSYSEPKSEPVTKYRHPQTVDT